MTAKRGWSAARIGYCSNVHAYRDLDGLMHSIADHFVPLRESRGLAAQASGLWIGARAAAALRQEPARAAFIALLRRSGLQLITLNGFPYGDFHRGAVKTAAYQPDWSDPQRLEYSLDLARLLAAALPHDCDEGVVSTVPLGYARTWDRQRQESAEALLRKLTESLAQLRARTGKKIIFCLEMEPDCVLETTAQAVVFFRHWRALDPHREHLGVCFDVCHQAVAFEDCYQSLRTLRQAQVPIGKIQLSNALRCRLPADPSRRADLLQTLDDFAESTYLHQTKALDAAGQPLAWPDLPAALAALRRDAAPAAELRIHFHVPLFAGHLLRPELQSSHAALARTFDYLADHPQFNPVLEVETYSWNVLPPELRPAGEADLLRGIADELRWVEARLRERDLLQEEVTEDAV